MKKLIIALFFIILSMPFGICQTSNSEAIKAYNMGIEYFGEQDYEKSIDAFMTAVKYQPDFYEAYYNLGQVYLSLDKKDEAIKYYELAVKYQPQDYDSCYILGELLYKRGYLSRSISYFSKIPKESDLYADAMEFKERVIKRQKEVLENEAKIKAEADKLKIKGLSTVEDITGIPAPSGVAGDSKGNIYVASYGDNRIYKIDLNGKRSTFVSENVIKGPVGLAVDSSDNLYVANYGMGNILKVYPTGAPYVFTKILKPYCVSVVNGYLYVTEQETNKVMRFKI